jgi:hypothetical protein
MQSAPKPKKELDAKIVLASADEVHKSKIFTGHEYD